MMGFALVRYVWRSSRSPRCQTTRPPPQSPRTCSTTSTVIWPAESSSYVQSVITGLAHTGVCVPDCEAAVAFYRDVLGLRVLSPPYVMAGDAIRDDMGQLVSDPTMKAAIVGFDDDGDRALEVIEYLGVAGGDERSAAAITDHGLSHVGLICDDLDATRAELEAKGVRFLVDGVADVARVRTTWFVDPWGVVFILVEKSKPERPYFAQWD